MMRSLSFGDDDLRRFCALPGLGELDPGAVRRHAPDAALLDEQGGQPVGRASLWWRAAPPYRGERVGLIGHYAATHAAAAARVLEAACARLRRAGCTLAVGPIDGSTWRRYRLLTERGSEPVFFLEPDNPDDWPAHFEAAGFAVLARYYSALCEDLGAVVIAHDLDARLRARGCTVRAIERARIDEELSLLWALASDAFADNLLYAPVGEAEFRAMHAPLLPLTPAPLVLIAECDGRPAGFSLALPDVLQARRGRPIDTLVLKTLGVARRLHGQGIGKWLFDRTILAAQGRGLRRAIYALIREGNPSGRLAHPSGREFRRYALYAREL
jgi:GNAT superfamily N-acetyltransferase